MAQDTKEALEQLTDSVNRSNSLLETIKGALSQQISASEGLKTAMIKSNTFSQGKMFKALNMVADLPGRFDKVLKSFGQFLQEGLGANNKEFLGALSKIEALGLNSAPFLQLTRAMNNKMGESVEQQTKALTQLMNLRDLTKANPELLATALNKHQQTFVEAAGIYGPQFSQDIRAVMSTLGAHLPGAGAMTENVVSLLSNFMGESPEKRALRGRIPGLPEDLSKLTSPEQIFSQFVVPLTKFFSESPLFQGPNAAINKEMFKDVFGLESKDFVVLEQLGAVLGEDGAVGKMSKAMKQSLEELRRSQDIQKKLSFVMDGISNAFFSILTPSMEYLSGVMGEEGLGGKVVDLSKQIADWIGGELKTLTVKAVGILSEFKANGGITTMQEKIAEAGKRVGEIWDGAKKTVTGIYMFLEEGGLQEIFNNVIARFKLWEEQIGERFDQFLPQFGQIFIDSVTYMGQVLMLALQAGAYLIWEAITELFPDKQTAEKSAAKWGMIAGGLVALAGLAAAPFTLGSSLALTTAALGTGAAAGLGTYALVSSAGGAMADAKASASRRNPTADFLAQVNALERPNFEMSFAQGSRELELLAEVEKSNARIQELLEKIDKAMERTADATEGLHVEAQE